MNDDGGAGAAVNDRFVGLLYRDDAQRICCVVGETRHVAVRCSRNRRESIRIAGRIGADIVKMGLSALEV